MTEKQSVLYYERFDRLDVPVLKDILCELGLWESFERSQHLVIKPSLCAGASTHFTDDDGVWVKCSVAKRLCEALLALRPTGKIFIVESDSTGHGFAFEKFRRRGYVELSELDPRIVMVDLTRGEHVSVPLPDGRFFKTVALSKTLMEGHFFISLAKMKTHNLTGVTGALKNQFGCLPYLRKNTFHPYISRVVADINGVIRPDLSVLESLPGMEGNGPVFGEPVMSDVLVFSDDPVAVDARLCRMAGLRLRHARHIGLAADANLGTSDLSRVRTVNPDLESSLPVLRPTPRLQRFFVRLGLRIQRCGDFLAHFGHLVHLVKSLSDLTKAYKVFRLKR